MSQDNDDESSRGPGKRLSRQDVPFSMINFDVFQSKMNTNDPTLYQKYVYIIEKKKPVRYYMRFQKDNSLLLFKDTQTAASIRKIDLRPKVTLFRTRIKNSSKYPFRFQIYPEGRKRKHLTFCTQNKVEFSDWERIFANSGFKKHNEKKIGKQRKNTTFGSAQGSSVRVFTSQSSLPAPAPIDSTIKSRFYPQIPLTVYPYDFTLKPFAEWTHKDICDWSKVFLVTQKYIPLYDKVGPAPKRLTISKMTYLTGEFLIDALRKKELIGLLKSLGFKTMHDILSIKKSLRLMQYQRYFNAGRCMAKEKAIILHQKHGQKISPAELNLWADRKLELYDLQSIHDKINRMYDIPSSESGEKDSSSEPHENEMKLIDQELIDDVSFNRNIGLTNEEEDEGEEEVVEEDRKKKTKNRHLRNKHKHTRQNTFISNENEDGGISYRFRVKLIITENIQDEKLKALRKVMGIAMKLSPSFSVPKSVKWGFFHVAVTIGPIQYDFNDSGFVHIRRTTSRNVILCLDVDNLIVQQKKKDHPYRELNHFTREVSKILLYWNVNKRYESVSTNCQTFVTDFLQRLGGLDVFKFGEHTKKFLDNMKFKGKCKMKLELNSSFIKKFNLSCEYFNKICGGESNKNAKKLKVFKPTTHTELDEFLLNCLGVCPTFRMDFYSEYELLKGFDRAFWMRHFRDTKNKDNIQDQKYGCPFNWEEKKQEGYRDSLLGENFVKMKNIDE